MIRGGASPLCPVGDNAEFKREWAAEFPPLYYARKFGEAGGGLHPGISPLRWWFSCVAIVPK
ncbi:hypothetical protein AGR6A_pAt60032 [Agrobacterium sp. NCPPB 925]|nr:hypothetical protein AGR6A_pAt60032 [Agrobacterium sp. NCPPB 925]